MKKIFTLGPIDIDQISKTCHEVNLAIQKLNNEPTLQSWDEAPDYIKASCRQGVLNAMKGETPEQLHESWMAFRIADGWTYGLTKDPVKKTHPCIVPYEELDDFQQLKDAVFIAVVNSFNVNGN